MGTPKHIARCRVHSTKHVVSLQEQDVIGDEWRTATVAVLIDALQGSVSLSIRYDLEGREATVIGNEDPGDVVRIVPGYWVSEHFTALWHRNCLYFSTYVVGATCSREI